jgi:hypothetical protein
VYCRAEKERQVAQCELGDLLQAADRAGLERAAYEKQIKSHLAQEKVSVQN